jgi:hypothetical protein
MKAILTEDYPVNAFSTGYALKDLTTPSCPHPRPEFRPEGKS